MPISYSIDVDFDITIPNFAGVANINGISNYIKAQNEVNREGANNNGWGGTSNNEDGDNKEDISSIGI